MTDSTNEKDIVFENEVYDPEEQKSKLVEWIESKHEKIIDDWQKFIQLKKSEGAGIKSINIIPIISNLLSLDNRVIKLRERKFDNAEEVETCFELYKEIVATFNHEVVYIPSQQSFCMFMGWTDRVYKQMLNETPEEIKDIMQMVDAYLFECQLSAAQSGFAGQSVTKFRSQLAGEKGMNLVTQKELNMSENTTRKMKTHEDLVKQLKDMGGLIGVESESKSKTKKKKSDKA